MNQGFTLVEVIVVSALILLISLVGFQTADVIAQREKEDRLRYALLEMRAAMDLYHQEKTVFPKSFDELLNSKRFGNAYGYYLRRLPLNPIYGTVKWEIASQTKRVYATPAEEQAHWKEISNSAAIIGVVGDEKPVIDVRCPEPGYTSLRGDSYTQW